MCSAEESSRDPDQHRQSRQIHKRTNFRDLKQPFAYTHAADLQHGVLTEAGHGG